ncbi:MAG: ATP-binding protein [Desulfobulbales bacterium]|nr:ATP-binding protein [Desulfobulbales bacterium]
MNWLAYYTDKGFLLDYHTGEEFLIALICLIIAGRFALQHKGNPPLTPGQENRAILFAASFLILGISSLFHAIIHLNHFNLNLLYQTLLGYCFGLLTFIVAISSENPGRKKIFLLFYLPLLAFLLPDIYEKFPIFARFRPLVWISVAYLSGLVCMLLFAAYYRTRKKDILWSAIGFVLVCVSSTFLFFPAPIGSRVWLHGHLFRPVGFIILLFSINRMTFASLGSSILFRALTAFSLLTAVPLLLFGTVIFYEDISPLNLEGRRILVFILMLISFAATLIFGLGLIIRLVRPILLLKDSVDRLVDEGFNKNIPVSGNDEIGELSNAFNEMVLKLGHAVDEQERLCRLAATGELAATLAHEIKNPLNAIGGAAGYIRKNYSGSLIEEFTGVISDEVSRINKLTGTLLGFAKPLNQEITRNDLNEIVRSTISLLGEEAKSHGIKITHTLDQSLPPVNCDQNQIKQVLINLMINAFDAIENDGEVALATFTNRGKTHLVVEDDGVGISPERAKYVFNPFYTTKTRGTGLGLAISKKIAREHQGDLVLQSTEGHGSTFTLIL